MLKKAVLRTIAQGRAAFFSKGDSAKRNAGFHPGDGRKDVTFVARLSRGKPKQRKVRIYRNRGEDLRDRSATSACGHAL